MIAPLLATVPTMANPVALPGLTTGPATGPSIAGVWPTPRARVAVKGRLVDGFLCKTQTWHRG